MKIKASKQKLVDAILEQMKRNVVEGDITVEESLFMQIPKEKLLAALPEDEWDKFIQGKVKG